MFGVTAVMPWDFLTARAILSTVCLRLPNFLHKEVKEISKEESISINQCIATALVGKNGGTANPGVPGATCIQGKKGKI